MTRIGWLRWDDGTWAAVDEYGIPHPIGVDASEAVDDCDASEDHLPPPVLGENEGRQFPANEWP